MNKGITLVPKKRIYQSLPIKKMKCHLCTSTFEFTQESMQAHLDNKHKGWVQDVFRKLPHLNTT